MYDQRRYFGCYNVDCCVSESQGSTKTRASVFGGQTGHRVTHCRRLLTMQDPKARRTLTRCPLPSQLCQQDLMSLLTTSDGGGRPCCSTSSNGQSLDHLPEYHREQHSRQRGTRLLSCPHIPPPTSPVPPDSRTIGDMSAWRTDPAVLVGSSASTP